MKFVASRIVLFTFAQSSPQVAGSCQTVAPDESGKSALAMSRFDSCLS